MNIKKIHEERFRIIHHTNKVLEFIERWNKQDGEIKVAESAEYLKRNLVGNLQNKTLKELLYITEDVSTNKWFISFRQPEFQGGDSEEISKEEAVELLSYLKNKLLTNNSKG